jgi:thiamine biosynthesis lipoprotein
MILQMATQAMRTRFELVLSGGDESALRSAGEAAIEEIERTERRLSFFRKGSLLSLLNREAADRPIEVDRDTLDLFRIAMDVHAASNGAFDPTVAPLMRAWGFRGDPDVDAEVARALVGLEAVRLDEDRWTIHYLRPGLAVDLGGIAKGHALDLAADVLRDCDVESALIHGGTSTVVAIGRPPDAETWDIAIGDAADDPVVSLRDCTLSVSSPSGREASRNGRVLGHVMDPRTGVPVAPARGAAVVAPHAALADAWSTALLVDADPTPAVEAGLAIAIRTSPEEPWSTFGSTAPWRHRASASVNA